jgi:hypothetical protein
LGRRRRIRHGPEEPFRPLVRIESRRIRIVQIPPSDRIGGRHRYSRRLCRWRHYHRLRLVRLWNPIRILLIWSLFQLIVSSCFVSWFVVGWMDDDVRFHKEWKSSQSRMPPVYFQIVVETTTGAGCASQIQEAIFAKFSRCTGVAA